MIKNKAILAIGAHPDDIEYYAGGTLLKLAPDNRLFYVIATDGGLNGDGRLRRAEQAKASLRMGVEETIFLDYPDLGLEDHKKELERDLLKVILRRRPQLIFSFDPENQFRPHADIHPDHRALGLIVADLTFLHSSLGAYLKKINLPERPLAVKPGLWLFDPYLANYRQNIRLFWPQKMALLKLFASQNLGLKTIGYQEAFKKVKIGDKI